MRKKNSIFIAATGQHVGKTTFCLGLIAALQKRYPSVGFIKPVGQQHVKIGENTIVDKDVELFKKHYHLKADWQDMSPVIIPAGFTRDFLDEKVSENDMCLKITHSFDKIFQSHAYTVVEGTGHVGVGSIVHLNNAQVAALLGLDMVLIASGGLGSAFDELILNLSLCKQYGVHVRGIILNKVLAEKREMILEYFPKALKALDIPLIGCVPYNKFLSSPALKDFENLFKTSLLSGKNHRYHHFQHSRLVAGSSTSYEEEAIPNELVITPADREDIIEAVLKKHQQIDFQGGMILTGHLAPKAAIIAKIQKADIPVLYVPVCSYDAMELITSFKTKIRSEDTLKVEKAIQLVEENVDIDLLCNR